MSEPIHPCAGRQGRRRRHDASPKALAERVNLLVADRASRVALDFQRSAYGSGLDILCLAAEHGLTALRQARDGHARELASLPPEAHRRWDFDEYGGQFEITSPAADLETDIEMATDALNELRKAFAVAAYHHWERSVIEWWHAARPTILPPGRPPFGYDHLKKAAKRLSVRPAPALNKVVTLANALKHNDKRRWNELKKQWPEVIARERYRSRADWAGTIQLNDTQLLEVFQAVQQSGPSSSQQQKWSPLPFTPRDDA
ncbi:hypothetical protein HLH33_13640 [Gluconacetobacter diazotrophicus]|uniref:Uncharacterized protein n=1 Tax=Gluconacetobacter diazotrophicus TaxID=33996 RepID=A0A7W4I6W8_GLUDI|nr:hypothetical protein [Gluconacetobacter diazotrophicus]MBB2157342.1 hypothetical protein [Gluconacetobacter diazotrophicus]